MLPQILPENQLRVFKFWFYDGTQDGLHYQNELFYRARTVEANQRARLYQLACRLSDRNANVVISAAEDSYSLWISLRNQKLAVMALHQTSRSAEGDLSFEALTSPGQHLPS